MTASKLFPTRTLAPLLLLAFLVQAATAEPFHHGPHEGAGDSLMRHADELELDAETRAKIEALVDGARSTSRPQREQLRAERERLRELLSQAAPELSVVLAQADVITNLEGQLLKQRLESTVAIRALLTPEQREKLVARSGELRSRHDRWRAERLRETQAACGEEIERSCADKADDPRALRHCLLAADSISPVCAEELFERGRPGRAGAADGVARPGAERRREHW